MVRNNIVLVKRDTPLRVTLPNGRTFLAKYRMVNRNYLPGGTTIARTYRGQPVQSRRPTGGRRPPATDKPAAVVRPPGVVIKSVRSKTRAARSTAWRRQRQGGKDVLKTAASNPYAQEVGKKILTKGINAIPALFKKGTKRIKNKHLRRLAQSEIALDMVDRGTKRLLRESNDRLLGGIGKKIWQEYQILRLKK